MARKLQDKTNVDAPSGTYPYGRIRDDSGIGDGTPVDEPVYGDFHQFFARLLDLANINGNGLPENVTNGFQYSDALEVIIGAALDILEADLLNEIDDLDVALSADIANLQSQIDILKWLPPIEIGNWNIYATGGGSGSLTKTLAHGFAADFFKKVRSVTVVVRNDADTNYYFTPINATIANIDNTNIFMSSSLDFPGFQTEGGYNRGWITIGYVD